MAVAGEVGIPPSIDWAGSENVKEDEFLWPAPERFTAFGIENFGYHDEVVFPLRIALSEPGAPVRLNADVSLLTYSTVCVPQDFTLTLPLPRASGIDTEAAALISAHAQKVPDEGAESGIRVQSAYLDPDMTAPTLTARPGVTAMQADWSRPNEAISRYLETFARYGIPFNAVYGPGAPEGIVQTELLSPEAVMSALEQAAERAVASGN